MLSLEIIPQQYVLRCSKHPGEHDLEQMQSHLEVIHMLGAVEAQQLIAVVLDSGRVREPVSEIQEMHDEYQRTRGR